MRIRTALASMTVMALLATAGTAALATSEPEDEPIAVDVIEGLTWELQEQAIDGQLTALPDGVVVTLLMVDGRAGGRGGCNDYITSYARDADALTFGEIASTLKLCAGPAGEVETAYFANLALVATAASTGGSLVMNDGDSDEVLIFVPAPEPTVVGSWVAQGINNQAGGVDSRDITSLVTAEFGEDGSLGGSDGCNDYSTTYEVDGDGITIAPEIASTLMACPEDIMEQASWYISALTSAATWSIDPGGALELRDADGALQVRYDPAS